MEKLRDALPTKFAEQGIKMTCEVPEYVPAEEEAPTDAQTLKKIGLGEPFWMDVTINDRAALLNDVIEGDGVGSKVKKFVAGHIPDAKFNEAIAKKLQEKVPAALEEKAGIKCTCEKIGLQKECVLVKIVIVGFDMKQLLTMGKGAEFAA